MESEPFLKQLGKKFSRNKISHKKNLSFNSKKSSQDTYSNPIPNKKIKSIFDLI